MRALGTSRGDTELPLFREAPLVLLRLCAASERVDREVAGPSLPYRNTCTVLGMVMIPEELERFAWQFGVLRTTVMHMANPVDQPDRWRHEWAEVKELVAEIDRLHAALPPGT
jgi:hypothetical protein